MRRSGDDWIQDSYLKASNAGSVDSFGRSVAIQNDLLIIGADGEDSDGFAPAGDDNALDSGAAYVFQRDNGNWVQRRILKAPEPEPGSDLGTSVAISGDLLAAGLPGARWQEYTQELDDGGLRAGAVQVFGGRPDDSTSLTSLELDGFSLDQIFQSAQTVYSASVGFLAGSVRLVTDSGAPVTIRVNGGAPVTGDVELLLAEGSNEFDIEVISEDGLSSTIYTLTVTREASAAFGQRAYLKASNAAQGDEFGVAVAMSGDTLVVGAPEEDSDGSSEADNSESGAGAAYVFVRDAAGDWTQQAYLKASNVEGGDAFGKAVAIDGDWIVVGAPEEDSGGRFAPLDNSAFKAGAAYVFRRDMSGTWTEHAYLKARNADTGYEFGGAVAISGRTIAVGSEGRGELWQQCVFRR